MQRYRNILVAAGMAAALWLAPLAPAQINQPTAAGFIERALLLDAAWSARGVIDQSVRSLALYPSASEREDALFLAATASLAERDPDAQTRLDAFVAAYPESPRACIAAMAAADVDFAGRDYPAALARYVRLNPRSLNDRDAATLAYRTAYCRLLLAEYPAAAQGFQAVAANSAADKLLSSAAVFYLGYIDYRQGENDSAMKRFQAAAKSADSEIAGASQAYMAQIYYSRGDNERALAAARRAIKEAPAEFHAEARRIAGESLYNLGRTDEATDLLYLYAESVETPAPTALYILGTEEFRKGNYSAASTLLQSVAADPSAMGQSAGLFLGQAYVKEGRTDAALLAFERAAAADYDPAVAETAAFNYAVAGLDGGRAPFASSVAALESFLNRFPRSRYAPQVEEYIINGYMTDRNYEAALESLDRIQQPSDNLRAARQRVVFALAQREYGEGKLQQALNHFKQAAALKATPYDPATARASQLWQGLTELALDRPAEAAKTLQAYTSTAAKNDADLPVALYNLGYARWDNDDLTGAAEAFRRVGSDGRIAPSLRSDARARVADALYASTDYSGAAAEYAEAYALNPSAADYALFQQAIMEGLQRNHRAKITRLGTFAEQFPTSALRPDALLEKAESQIALGENATAIQTYESLTREFPQSAAARQGRLRMAVTRAADGSTDAAIADYRALVEQAPTSAEARLAIDDLKRIYSERGDIQALTSWLAGVEGAPELDPSELDRLAFVAAEKEYMEADKTTRIAQYLRDYPRGANAPRALYYMAEAAALESDFPTAYSYASRLLEAYPDADVAPDALLIRADAEAAQGKTEAAFQSYSALAERAANPSQLKRARLGILRAATDLGRNDAAVAAADALLSSTAAGGGERNEVMLLRGLALDRAGSHDQAYAQWDELIAAAPDDVAAARAAVEKGTSLLALGRTADAHTATDRFINSNPASQYWLARAFILLSDILAAEGNDFEAREYLNSLRTNYPGTEQDILRMIDERLSE